MVYVISYEGKPLMPCTPVVARLLLKQRKAKCIKRTPFTIKLLYQTTSYIQPLTLGIDTGSSVIGSAVVSEEGDVLYLSEIEIRNDISGKMQKRSRYRRNRRNRKTRYRKARWLNRKNSIRKDRVSPTMVSKINSHLKEIRFAKSVLPIRNIILETATFDPHALKNPSVLKNKWLYQKGINYGFANTKAYVLDRDAYTCQNCKGKSKDKRHEVHHIQFKSEQGSDDAENLIVLCKSCHNAVHKEQLYLNRKGKKRGILKHVTQMNSIRIQLLRLLPFAEETFGFITKEHRQIMNLSKTHYNDAIVIASLNNIQNNGLTGVKTKVKNIILKKCISDGDYQKTKGARSEKIIPTGKIEGFKKFDKVKHIGEEYFVKGRMSAGYAILMDICGNKINLIPIPKLKKMKRVNSRKHWIMIETFIPHL
jgi:hypothetical protein